MPVILIIFRKEVQIYEGLAKESHFTSPVYIYSERGYWNGAGGLVTTVDTV